MYHDQLMALTDLGHEIHLWHFASGEGRERFRKFVETEPGIWGAVQQRCSSVYTSEYRNGETMVGHGLGKIRSLMLSQLPVLRWSLYQKLQGLLLRIKPQVIWAQHFESATLAAQQRRIPVVYVHHDWLYRIKAFRNSRPVSQDQKTVEERLVRSVSAVVTGSKVEQAEIAAVRGAGVHYIPVSYESVDCLLERSQAERPPRLVHLGTMNATANREGLLAFFERAWPQLKNSNHELAVVGDVTSAPTVLQAYLQQVTCTGFVKDLRPVLRPFDLHVVPWGHATGQRTRVPLAFNYAQVLVAVRAGVACYPEAEDGVNCRLVDKLEDMAPVISELAADVEQRFRLGQAAKQTFEKYFTRPALLPRYSDVFADLQRKATTRTLTT